MPPKPPSPSTKKSSPKPKHTPASMDRAYSPLVRSLKGAIRIDAKEIDYKEILEDEMRRAHTR